MTPRQAIFVRLVHDGMRRAYRAAEVVERTHGILVATMLTDHEGEIDRANPAELPEVRFVCCERDDGDGIAVSIGASFAEMFDALEERFVYENPDVFDEAMAKDD
jgi:hypothetical protein